MAQARGKTRASEQAGKDGAKRPPEKTSVLEWCVAALGGLLVFGTIAYMIYYGVSHPETPPDIIIRHEAGIALDGGYLVEFTARNDGNTTAANVLVTGTLSRGGAVVEESEASLDYVPQQSERKGGLMFTRDPSTHDLELTASGYAAP